MNITNEDRIRGGKKSGCHRSGWPKWDKDPHRWGKLLNGRRFDDGGMDLTAAIEKRRAGRGRNPEMQRIAA